MVLEVAGLGDASHLQLIQGTHPPVPGNTPTTKDGWALWNLKEQNKETGNKASKESALQRLEKKAQQARHLSSTRLTQVPSSAPARSEPRV